MSTPSGFAVPIAAEPLAVGIDVGTTHLKVAVYDAALNSIWASTAPTPAGSHTSKGEVDAQRLWLSLKAELAAAMDHIGPQLVSAVGIAGMAESGCLIDATGRPLTPILLWHDRRGTRQAAAWRKRAGDAFEHTTGLRMTNVRSLAKWRWMVEAGARADARWCGAPEWIALCLTGRWVTDSTLAVRTGALDVLKDEYSRELLDIAGAPLGLFPPVSGTPARAGGVLPQVARELGMSESAQVVIGGHDDIAAAYGADGRQGDLIDSGGTAEGLVRIVASPPIPRETVKAKIALTRYYLPHTWALIAGAGATGALMERVAGMLGLDPARLDAEATPSGRYRPGVIQVRLSERGLPMVRLDPRAPASEVWSAVLDLVGERMARTASRLSRMAGPPHRTILIGGAAGSRALAARKSTRLGMPVVQLAGTDATTRGAAALARLARESLA